MDIQKLIAEAKHAMLTTGHVLPMAYLDLKSRDPHIKDIDFIMALDIFSDTQSIPLQGGIAARVAWEECKKYPGHTPTAAGLYTEAWRVKAPVNDTQKMRPKLSPKRQEVIMVEAWHAEGDTCVSYRLPVIRDHKNRVVLIKTAEESTEKSVLFSSFLQGISDSQKPDEETFATLESSISNHIARLSSKERQSLRDFAKSEGIPSELLDTFLEGI